MIEQTSSSQGPSGCSNNNTDNAGAVQDDQTSSNLIDESTNETVDIASSLQKSPIQPVNYPFPSTVIGDKEHCFNPKWYEQYEWLEYSIAKDAVFCYPCRFFAHASSKAEDRFVTLGYRDWKHAGAKGGAFAKHNTLKNHKEAFMNWSQYKILVATGTSVANKLDSARKEQIKKNRHYLTALIHSLMYCATQEIALQGHREKPSSSNKGNFLELVNLLAIYDPIIKDQLTCGPQNAQYTSHNIQNQLLHILGQKLRQGICHQI